MNSILTSGVTKVNFFCDSGKEQFDGIIKYSPNKSIQKNHLTWHMADQLLVWIPTAEHLGPLSGLALLVTANYLKLSSPHKDF